MRPENLLLIDIETVPMEASYHALHPRMQSLWQKKSKLLEPESTDFEETFFKRAGVYAEFGKIICIAVAHFEIQEGLYHLHLKYFNDVDEKKLLQTFTEYCNSFFKKPSLQFCGHNIREFDIPYICRRCLIQGVKLPLVLNDLQQRKPWENPMLDTMQFWKFGEFKHFTSVDLLAAILGIPSPKTDINGADVAGVYWKKNDLARITRYCLQDVVTVAQILMRLNELELLEEKQINLPLTE
ncbi:MAG: ribonuclease H-like domain-containing protein [Chitinophagaceae bacterium]|jgi:DNA polymerase elongation subunit (family B)